MKFNSIRLRLAFSYAAIALLATVSLGLVLYTVLREYYDNQEARYLQESAMRVGIVASELMEKNVPVPLIQDQATSWSFFLQARVRIEDASGRVIADSGVPNNQQLILYTSGTPSRVSVPFSETVPMVPPGSFSIHIVQKQSVPVGEGEQVKDFVVFGREAAGVTVAMPADDSMYGLFRAGDAGVLVRRSSQAVAQRIINERGVVLGALILSDGPAYGDEILHNVMNGLVVAGVIAVLLAAFAGWFFSNRITSPVVALTQITSRMAAGDLTARANVRGNDEMGMLGLSFNEMASRVEEVVGTLRSFAADAAHELHTPLTALQTNLELAREEKNASNRTLYLSRAQEQSQRLETLVSSLLDLSRIESAEVKSRFEQVDISKIIHEVAEQFASRAEQSNRIFRMEMVEGELETFGDAMQLRQVFVNLFENAIKFTQPNDVISISAAWVEGKIKIKISDTGIGIPTEDLPNMFRRFHRGRNVSELSGNGLGLAIVKAIIQRHGGDVQVASEGVGRGSEFVVTLSARL
ncbi:MAG: HAMP domain-containing histidine kinase [Anaerolineales bacterium]|nr:HAMP domain-containing histidine kinase [Anaerolineales bacterium]